MNARDLMTAEELWVAGETATAREVAHLMAEHDVGAIPVMDPNGRLEGIITDRDICCRTLGEDRGPDTPVRQVMSPVVHTVFSDTPLKTIEDLMREHKIHRLPVIDDDDRLLGFISLADLFRHVHGRRQERELIGVLESIYEED